MPPKDQEKIPDLDCEGSLNWDKIKTGKTIDGNIQIKNIGEEGSLLNWRVKSYPDWGEWSFDPEFGENLTPTDGVITVNISIIVPDEKKTDFKGFLRIENQDNPKDCEVITVSLKTPANKHIFNLLLNQLSLKYEQFFRFLEVIFDKYGYN